LDAIEMPLAIHRRTRLALALYRALAAGGEGPALPAWKHTIAPGDAPEGLDAIAARLDLLDDLPGGTVTPARYEGPLVLAVQQFAPPPNAGLRRRRAGSAVQSAVGSAQEDREGSAPRPPSRAPGERAGAGLRAGRCERRAARLAGRRAIARGRENTAPSPTPG